MMGAGINGYGGGVIHNWYIQKPNAMTINKLYDCKLMDFILTAVKICGRSQIICSDFSDSTFFSSYLMWMGNNLGTNLSKPHILIFDQ